MIRHGLGQQVCRLLSAPQKYLQLAAVRVLRAIIGTKEALAILVLLAIQGGWSVVVPLFFRKVDRSMIVVTEPVIKNGCWKPGQFYLCSRLCFMTSPG